jgi:hypothetical protein
MVSIISLDGPANWFRSASTKGSQKITSRELPRLFYYELLISQLQSETTRLIYSEAFEKKVFFQ